MRSLPSLRSLIEEQYLLSEASILKNKYPFKAVLLLGPAGAGKTFMAKAIGIPKEFVYKTADTLIEKEFPRFNIPLGFGYPGTDLYQLQQKARKVLQYAARNHIHKLILKGTPLVLETTGEKIEDTYPMIEALAHIGYDVAVLLINVPTDVSTLRDYQRKRTLGPGIIEPVSLEYQNVVLKQEQYINHFKSNRDVVILGDEPFPNIFCLSAGGCKIGEKEISYGELLPDVDRLAINQKIDANLSPFKHLSADYVSNLLKTIKNDFNRFLTSIDGPHNDRGKKIFHGMKELVKVSGGKLGQTMLDIHVAMQSRELAENEKISNAAIALSDITEQDLATAAKKKEKPDYTIRGLTDIKEMVNIYIKDAPTPNS